MHRSLRSSLALLGMALVTTCVTPSAKVAAPQLELQRFADALSAAGMSVAVAPRVCEPGRDDVAARCATSWDDHVGCVVDGACACDEGDCAAQRKEARLTSYARAVVAAHLPDSPPERADALVHAYVDGDPKLVALARSVEDDFDGRRKHPLHVAREKNKAPAKDGKVSAKDDAVDAGVRDDAGEGAHDTREHRASVDVDGGPAGATLHDRVVGTWSYDSEEVKNVYSFCDDGHYTVRFEVRDASLGSLDLPKVHGTWEAHEDTHKLTFVSSGDSADATIGEITDETLELTMDSEVMHLVRTSTKASCE